MSVKNESRSNIQSLILDMDGVLWRGDLLLVDLPATFEVFKARGWRVILATNNSTRSIDYYLTKLRDLGVYLEGWQVINSAQATSHYLKSAIPKGSSVYVIGEKGLVSTLRQSGFRTEGDTFEAVVAGLDREITYEKLRRATLLIREGVPFIGTNPDRSFPVPEGLVPGAGSILAALEAATDVKPLVIGKPQSIMYQQAMERLGTPPETTLAIGDRVETDIVGGQKIGCMTALVLSGVTSKDNVAGWSPPPDYVARDLNELLEILG